ncbi:LOW QUALITY PROTEIN: amiloride-sensitive sodium channel subunit alpha-like [Heteronotia binoei]|uniref:LOW QUALITY PROTEIN: amiloride-sensitive sodium channel subunit alpha-like n=1 Tax=Heteronotia binoei TaxID=13085 RepID=UPI0029301CD5|nr:LOW QUALITY PROTEIN: amiloride-sensitive sodium channel subunit alpha-like [Heteronotia binoei]
MRAQPSEGLFEFPASYQELFEFFCTHSTVHGAIRLVCPAENKMKTTFWTVLFLLTVAVLYWQFGDTLQRYYGYPVNLKISLCADNRTFPAVTLCTLRPQRYSAIQEELQELDRIAHQALKDLYGFEKAQDHPLLEVPHLPASSTWLGHIQRHPLQHLTSEDPTSLEGSSHDGGVGFLLCNESNGDCFYQTFSSGIDAVQEWYRFHYINLLARLPSGQVPDEDSDANFIISCRFNKESCNKDNFTHFRHPTYGNCFTLNDKTDSTQWMSSMPGIQHGLSLLLRTEQNDSIPLLSAGSGARVMVHDQNEPACMGEGGFDVRPGMQTSITVRKKVLEHLGGAYGRCSWNGSDVPVRNLYPSKYTEQACVHSCFQSIMVERCGCAYYFYPLPSEAEYCDYAKHIAWGHCFYRLQAEFKSNKLGCFDKCPKLCRVTQYLLSAAYSQWTSKEWVFHILAQAKEYNVTQRNSVSKVHIFFDEWRYKATQETPAFTVNMLISQLGAHWGLWFGSSVISLVEVLELMIDVVAVTCIVSFGFFHKISAPDATDAAAPSSCTPGDATVPCDHDKAEHPAKPSSLKPPIADAFLEPKYGGEAAFHLKPCNHDGITILGESSDPASRSCDSTQPRPGSYRDGASQTPSTPVFHSSLPIPCIIKDFVDVEPTGRDRDLELGL